MLKTGGLNDNRVLTVKVREQLTKEDYERFLPQLEEILEEHDAVRFYLELEDFSGFEKEALWKDIKFDFEYRDQYGKTAVVGDKKWEAWATKFSGYFFASEVRFFNRDQSDEAWDWVNS